MLAPLVLLQFSMTIINLISNNRSLDQTLLKLFSEDMLRKLSTVFYHPTASRNGSKNSHSTEEINVFKCQDYTASVVDEWSISVRHTGGMIWKGHNWSTHEKNLSQCHFWQSHTDWTGIKHGPPQWHASN